MSHEKGKVILITGATRGLGEAIARQLDGLGCQTMLTGRDEKALLRLEKELKHARIQRADLAELGQLESLVHQTIKSLGRLDGLINNAGTIDPIDPLSGCEPTAWIKAIEVNLTAPALLMRAALPELRRRQGRIVNISTGAAIKAMAGWSAYCASKAGLLHLSKVVAAEAPEVGVFSLRPGVIDTKMQEEIRQSEGMTPSDHQRFLDLKEKNGLEPPEVPAQAASWLVLRGPIERSGELIEYTDQAVMGGQAELFQT